MRMWRGCFIRSRVGTCTKKVACNGSISIIKPYAFGNIFVWRCEAHRFAACLWWVNGVPGLLVSAIM